jgi:carbon storage regulator
MLVLHRAVGQTLLIGATVTVKVLAINGMQVSLGIECPTDVTVSKQEQGGNDAGTFETPERTSEAIHE